MKDNQFYEITDAFLALRDIDDDAVEGMLRADKKARDAHIHEGKAFSIQAGSKDVEAAKQFLEEDAEDGDEIEVIDVDADTVDHIKKNAEYIGQGILCCNRCKANRFIDMDLLTASEVDEEVFNIDDECPHCHDAGSGYSLIGQVGKVQKEEPVGAPAEDAEATVANDEVDAEAAAFENDLEDEAEETPEEEAPAAEEEPEIDTFDETEDDGMETTTSEDELDDLDLPALGDEIDSDETDEDEDNVKESLHEDVQMNAMAEEAWMMNRVIASMNNEEAYYGSWLYLWPDGETKEECAYDFGDRESFEELKDKFIRTYKHYHADGLYNAEADVVEYAHNMDRQLGLAKIENLAPAGSFVRESFECSVAGDLFNAITSPENVDKIIIIDVSDEEGEPRKIYQGSKEDMPMNVMGSPCKSFDVADGYLSCNIDSDIENTNRPLNKALECFSDDKTDKVLIWDQAKGEEVFAGTKADACDKFGNCEFVSFETPAVIRINISNPGIISCDELEDEKVETDFEKLVKKIIDANNLSQYKTDKPNTKEYWIRACLEENDDVELIYESFVKPTENKELIKEFKAVTGYNNALEAAYDAGYAAAEVVNEDLADWFRKTFDKGASSTTQQSWEEHLDQLYLAAEDPDLTAAQKEKIKSEIKKIEAKFAQQRDWEARHETNEDVTLDTVRAEVAAVEAQPEDAEAEKTEEPAAKKEAVSCFKTRKELAEAVNDCKNNNKAYTIRRSTTEGYRYDLITEEVDDTEVTSLVPAEAGEIEMVDDIPQQMPTEYSPQQRQLMDNIHRVALDISDAIQRHYDIEADPQLIVADIIRDLQLISGDVSIDELGDSAADRATKDLFRSYTEFYAFVDELISAESGTTFVTTPEAKLRHAIQMLHGANFSPESIDRMIGSRAFIAAARGGNVPYIAASDIPLLEALDQMLDESVEVNTEIFDEEMNSYFNESYEDTVVYTTTEGHVVEDGTVVLEGIIQCDETVKPVTFTLTPEKKITEDVADKEAALAETLAGTFTVTNNISEEVFEFKFSK